MAIKRKLKAPVETASPPDSFMVLQEFENTDEEGRVSHYIMGLAYRIRNERLGKLAAQWAKDGKVSLGGPAARAAGVGKVES